MKPDQTQRALMQERKPYMGATKDYTFKDSDEFKRLFDHYIRCGERRKSARLTAKIDELVTKKCANSKCVSVEYKEGGEIVGKIVKFTYQYIALKVRNKEKPLYLDRRYIGKINIS